MTAPLIPCVPIRASRNAAAVPSVSHFRKRVYGGRVTARNSIGKPQTSVRKIQDGPPPTLYRRQPLPLYERLSLYL